MTGYKVAKRVNAALKMQGLKEIPPQMIYRYLDQKLIPFSEVEGQRDVSIEDADAWIAKYVAKRIERSA
jgi:hypothetical protein